MMHPADERDEVGGWAERLERAIRARSLRWTDRVAVIAETVSTQDAAVRMAAGRPGLMVLAVRQTAGRGRLGRSWSDPAGLGLAATFALDGTDVDDARMSLAIGLAACRTVEKAISVRNPGSERIGLRWPNDVMIAARGAAPRKVAGVLIERSGTMVYAGVGINVLQTGRDWPTALAGKAASLREFAPEMTRIEVAELVMQEIDAALRETTAELAEAWTARDMLVGHRAIFEHAGKRYEGVVKRIDPTSAVCLKLDSGAVEELPALTTSLVKE